MSDMQPMNGEEKLLMLSQQLDRMDKIGQFDLECPYCHSFTSPGKPFCCPTVTKAVVALLDARDKVKQIQHMRAN